MRPMPKYMQGGGYMLSRDLVEGLVNDIRNHTLQLPFTISSLGWLEDAAVGIMLANQVAQY